MHNNIFPFAITITMIKIQYIVVLLLLLRRPQLQQKQFDENGKEKQEGKT